MGKFQNEERPKEREIVGKKSDIWLFLNRLVGEYQLQLVDIS